MARASYCLSARFSVRKDCSPACVPKNHERRRNRILPPEFIVKGAESRFLQGIPRRRSDENPIITRASITGGRDFVEANRLHDGGKRKHGEGQQDKGRAGEQSAGLAAPHVADAQIERGKGHGNAPDIRLVNPAAAVVHLL